MSRFPTFSRRNKSTFLHAPGAGALAFLALACASLALLVASCGAPRPIRYYQLTYPAANAAQSSPYNATLLVRTFDASNLFKDNRIVYNVSPTQLGVYESERWISPPVEMLQDALIRGLRSSGRFRSVMSVRNEGGGDYALTGHIYEFGEYDGAEITARLNYIVRLRDHKTGMIVWTHVYNHDEPVAEKNMPAVVTAMDKNVRRSVDEVQAGLDEFFRSNPPQ